MIINIYTHTSMRISICRKNICLPLGQKSIMKFIWLSRRWFDFLLFFRRSPDIFYHLIMKFISSQSWYFLSPINRKKTFKMLMRWMERQRWEAVQKGQYHSVFGSVPTVPIPIQMMKSHSHISSTWAGGCLSVWDSVIGFCFWTQIQRFGWLNWLDQLIFALVLALLKLFIKFSPIMYHNILYHI